MAAPNRIAISVARGELIPPEPDRVGRRAITPGGALGLWDGFGTLTIRVGDRDVLVIQARENDEGEAIIRASAAPGVYVSSRLGGPIDVNLEQMGLIAPDSTSRDRGWIKEN